MTSQHEALTPVAAETERGRLCPACGGGLESEETERVANGGGGEEPRILTSGLAYGPRSAEPPFKDKAIDQQIAQTITYIHMGECQKWE